jgi:hypothetical protein
LRRYSCGFEHRPDLGLLILEKGFEAFPVRPLVQHHQAAAIVGAVEAVRDEAMALGRFQGTACLLRILREELLQRLRIPGDLQGHDH